MTLTRFNNSISKGSLIQIIISILLLISASAKLLSINEFYAVLVASGLFDKQLAVPFAKIFIALEFLTSILLYFKVLPKLILNGCALLFSTFAAYHAWNWFQGIGVPCTCFGALFKMPSQAGFILNLGLVTLCLLRTTKIGS